MDKQLLRQMYVYENKEMKEIGEHFGVHRKTVGNWIKREARPSSFYLQAEHVVSISVVWNKSKRGC